MSASFHRRFSQPTSVHAWRAILAAVSLASCGAPPGAPPPAHAEVETCQRERAALEQRLAAAEQRVEELEREATPPAPIATEPVPSDGETVRIRLPRDKFDALYRDHSQLMQSARILPAQENGRLIGIRILNVRPDESLARHGFQNGDIVQRVNDHELDSPAHFLEAIVAVRSVSELRIDMIRAGRRVRLVVEIVDPATR
jgi:type II secretory pathway component PulC